MTITPATDLPPNAKLQADVVIMGSGPAGLTMAMELARAGVDALVLESGGLTTTKESRDLDTGAVVGQPFQFGDVPYGTEDMRIRALGGSSGHWAGMCRPLDDIDFRTRPWVTGSGWPINRAELEPWYRKAEATLKLGTTGWDPEPWYERCGTKALFGSERLNTTIYQFSAPVRFGSDFADVLENEAGPRVILGATVVDAALNPASDRITQVTIRRADGATATATATLAFVLATGGLEVPRLLLAWGQGSAGLANSSGLVGRGYLDHPHRAAGQVRASLGSNLPPLYGFADAPGDAAPTKVWAGWSPTTEVQEAEGIGHGVAFLRFRDSPDSAKARPTGNTKAMGSLVAWGTSAKANHATVSVRCEQAPTAASRVTLGTKLDPTGLPRLRVDWQPSAFDERTAQRTVELLAEEFGRAGIGRIEVQPRGNPFATIPVEIGCHPMGSARMSEDPKTGVVGPDLRSHDLANLYVCSSAVFPTSGAANPTLTIVALAHRLAAELAQGRA